MDDNPIIISIYAGESKNGPIYEELLAIKRAEENYQLLTSPGLALGLAKDDIIKIGSDLKPEVVKHGGNFCIQIYTESIPETELKKLQQNVFDLLSGSLDGLNGRNLSLSIPSNNDMEDINNVFDEFKERTGIEWYYSNIYKNPDDLSDETLCRLVAQIEYLEIIASLIFPTPISASMTPLPPLINSINTIKFSGSIAATHTATSPPGCRASATPRTDHHLVRLGCGPSTHPGHRRARTEDSGGQTMQTFRYAYDALGRRIPKTDAFGTTAFAWDGDQLHSEQHEATTLE